jgi:hypothetical protein
MSSLKTLYHKFHKWVGGPNGDKVSRTEFDENFDAIDTKLGDFSLLQTAEKTNLAGIIVEIYNALKAIADGKSGADYIGATEIQDLDGRTVQTILESLRNKLKSVEDGSSGADFINATAIEGLDGSTVQALLKSLKILVDNLSITGATHDPFVTGALVDAENVNYGAGGLATYLQGRLTAWERRLLTSLAENAIINVKHFNVKGDGITDDTVNIQSAINYCSDNSKILYFPCGCYLISAPLYLKRNSHLLGCGANTGSMYSFDASKGSVIKLADNSNCNAIEITETYSSCSIRQIAIKGDYNFAGNIAKSTTGYGIHIADEITTLNSLTITECLIESFAESGIYIGHNAWVLTLHNCEIRRNQKYGLYLYNASDNNFSDLAIYQNGIGGIYEYQGSGNKFINIKVYINGVYSHNLNWTDQAIALEGASRIQFTNIETQENYNGSIGLSGCTDVTFTNLAMNNNGYVGINDHAAEVYIINTSTNILMDGVTIENTNPIYKIDIEFYIRSATNLRINYNKRFTGNSPNMLKLIDTANTSSIFIYEYGTALFTQKIITTNPITIAAGARSPIYLTTLLDALKESGTYAIMDVEYVAPSTDNRADIYSVTLRRGYNGTPTTAYITNTYTTSLTDSFKFIATLVPAFLNTLAT